MTSRGWRALSLVVCLGLLACSSVRQQSSGTGGMAGTGGTDATGGASGGSSGGTGGASTGGANASGGMPETGGAAGAGGTSTTGGASGTGGAHAGDAGLDSGSRPDLCELPFDVGPCDAAIQVYWFNAQTGACEMQTYGGCGGNDNRFASLDECSQACGGGDLTACQVDADCGWGEIDHEILKASDCTCLYGCPYLVLNQSTINRRQQQYDNLCDPSTDGNGQPCGIDDCIQPPLLRCVGGQCTEDTTAK